MADNKTTGQLAQKRAKQMQKAERVREVGRTLSKYFGDSPYAIMAMLGNIDVETGGSFDPKQKQYKGGPGRGLFQFDWHKKHYGDYLKEEGLEDSDDSQARYVYENIYGKKQHIVGEGNAKKLRAAFATNDSIAISDVFQNKFLRPQEGKEHTDRRRDATRMYTMAFIPAQ